MHCIAVIINIALVMTSDTVWLKNWMGGYAYLQKNLSGNWCFFTY